MERADKILLVTLVFGVGVLIGMASMVVLRADTSSEPVYETPRIRVRGDIYADDIDDLQPASNPFEVREL